MKRSVVKIVIIAAVVAVLGVIGKMDYADQQSDAELSKEIRQLAKARRAEPSIDPICLALSSHQQHCQPDVP